MDALRRFKKGEVFFKEGDPLKQIFVIQSGRVLLYCDRGGQRLEVATLGPGQVLGEQALFYNAKQVISAEALQETKAMEIPSELLKAQLEKTPAGIKLLTKALIDETKATRQALRALKLETEKAPCPQSAIPRIFSLLNLVARHTGVAQSSSTHLLIDWTVLKLYTARLFAESPQRMRSLIDLLLKLGHVQLQMRKTDEGEEELAKIEVFNIQAIEDFAEFYQYNLYKGGRSEVIYLDPLAFKVAKAFVLLSQKADLDRMGLVTLPFDKLLAEAKAQFKLELKNLHLDLLEKKGLFVKRSSRDEGLFLQFEKAEFEKISSYWSILHEIDQWNELGFVRLEDPKENAELAGGLQCASCQGTISEDHKFCPHCGAKVAQVAA